MTARGISPPASIIPDGVEYVLPTTWRPSVAKVDYNPDRQPSPAAKAAQRVHEDQAASAYHGPIEAGLNERFNMRRLLLARVSQNAMPILRSKYPRLFKVEYFFLAANAI